MIFQPPWTRQPQGPVKVSPAFGIRPWTAWIGSQPTVDHVSGNRFSFDSANNTINNRAYGRSVVSAVPSFPIERTGGSTAVEPAFTFVVVAHIGAGSIDHQLIGTSTGGGGFSVYGQTVDGTLLTMSKPGVGDYLTLTISLNTSYVFVGSHRTGTGEAYLLAQPVNGGAILSAGATFAAAANAGNGTSWVGGNSGGGSAWVGDVGMAVMSFNYIPEAVGRALLANPWQLFAPLPRRLWAPSAAGYPALSAATVTAITGTTATPRVTITI